ncbi:hypothetical protein TanjilG_00175 [Lupinus angustifolius]|uniref:UBC core domain-containing protein n=1 Tax=Lupinus angustifolius TaxID=3871 RepID=A0A1J7H9N3_LUPAN|nr:hypothetical protein TanjilG_00175 [Lupinus angustifolius]
MMSTPARKRLVRDFKRLQQDLPKCPDDTPWDGGTFKLTLQFYEDYLNKPSTLRFVSRMFHPNMNSSADLEGFQPFSHVLSLILISHEANSALGSIGSLLCDPNPNSPTNSEAARMYSENKREYNHRVRESVE